MPLHLPDHLPALIRNKYADAKAANALTFASSELAVLQVCGIPFQLRYCPSLAKKPTPQNQPPSSNPAKPKPDPFHNPTGPLLVTHVPASSSSPSHVLVLNKFPIIPHHFILATTQNKAQTHLLEQDDISIVYRLLQQWERSDEKEGKLFAFFNSGRHSGASQPHRHVQLLPVDDMRVGDKEGTWKLLADQVMAEISENETAVREVGAGLPCQILGWRIPKQVDESVLWEKYKELYRLTFERTKEFARENPEGLEELSEGGRENAALPLSYNLAMTTQSMMLCARRSEGKVVGRGDGSEIDSVALNGTMLGGTLMVKNDELFRILKDDPRQLEDVLNEVGIPKVEKVDVHDMASHKVV